MSAGGAYAISDGARFYSPKQGRFIQPDTLVPDPANPQSLNQYAYTLNNPLRYTDPTGHAWRDMNEGAGPYGTGSWAGALASAARTGQEYATIRALLVTVAAVAAEPIDWGVNIHQCATEGCNPALAALGLLPGISGSVAARLDDAVDLAGAARTLGKVGAESNDGAKLIGQIAEASTKNGRVRGGITMLGSFDEYINMAKLEGVTYFNMPKEVYKRSYWHPVT